LTSQLTLVVLCDEGQGANLCQLWLAPDDKLDFGAYGGMLYRDITHGYRARNGWTEASRRYFADGISSHIVDLNTCAGGGATLWFYPNQFARGAICELGHNARSAGKTTLGAAAFLNGPRETCLDGGCGGGDVIAIEAQPGFQS
jgi:hypothetical protein